MFLNDILYSQGFGTRRVCNGLIEKGLVATCKNSTTSNFSEKDWDICSDPHHNLDIDGLTLRIMGVIWKIKMKAYVMMHKPANIECSQKPSTYPSIYSLLPSPLRQRPARTGLNGIQAVGRLDQDTTGLLLLSDDGAFIHRMSSPKKACPKVYDVTLKHEIADDEILKLISGVILDDDPKPVRAFHCERLITYTCDDERNNRISLTLTQGKYHQVKRMIAAVGNRVISLHRSKIGDLVLPDDLLCGQWRWIESIEMKKLGFES